MDVFKYITLNTFAYYAENYDFAYYLLIWN